MDNLKVAYNGDINTDTEHVAKLSPDVSPFYSPGLSQSQPVSNWCILGYVVIEVKY